MIRVEWWDVGVDDKRQWCLQGDSSECCEGKVGGIRKIKIAGEGVLTEGVINSNNDVEVKK